MNRPCTLPCPSSVIVSFIDRAAGVPLSGGVGFRPGADVQLVDELVPDPTEPALGRSGAEDALLEDLHRRLRFDRDDPPGEKLRKLEAALERLDDLASEARSLASHTESDAPSCVSCVVSIASAM